MPRLLLILAAVGALGASPPMPEGDEPRTGDPCALCSGAKEVTCVTCSGRGRASVECPICRGAARTPCLVCKLDPKVRAELPYKVGRGMLACPNPHCDKKGMVTWKSAVKDLGTKERDPCKVCDGKGAYGCPTCTDGMAPCVGCAGRGRLDGTCRDCAGSGKLPCPGCTASPKGKACPFCHGAPKRSCELCKPGGKRPAEVAATVKCGGCAGTGSVICQECRGIGRMPCDGCGGTGSMRTEVQSTGAKAGKKSHDACKGAGWTRCEHCKNGRADCPKCKNGDVPVRCSGCRDAKTVVCHGCWPGGWNAFETCGRIVHAASRFEEASAFYSTALKRFTEFSVKEDLSDAPEAKRLVDAWLKAVRTRLEIEAAAADERKPVPAAGN